MTIRPALTLLLLGLLGGGLALFALHLLTGWPLSEARDPGRATAVTVRFAARPLAMPALERSLAGARPEAPPPRARGVVLLIGDGMGASQLMAGRIASVGVDGRLAIERMPTATWVSTHAERSLYTDSASAAAAMATGAKTAPGLLAQRADGAPLRTLFEAAREAGLETASVTDTYILDATPAAFLAHSRRRDFDLVARQAAASGIAVIAGTAVATRPGGSDDDGFVSALRSRGYTVVRDADAWRVALTAAAPIAGLFRAESIADPAAEPSLQALAADTYARLAAGDAGFLMLVETEEVDTGGHLHDFERVVRGVASLDRAAHTLIEAAAAAGDVLIIATADHETGGLGLLGGNDGMPLEVSWATDSHTAEPVPLFAFGPGAERFGRIRDNREIAGAIAAALGLDLAQAPPAEVRE